MEKPQTPSDAVPAQLVDQIAQAVVAALRGNKVVSGVAPTDGVITVGRLSIDLDRHEAYLDGKPLNLRPQEFALLTVLARHSGQVLTRDQLLDLAWPNDAALTVDDRTADVHIARLRRRLGGERDQFIRTVSKVGYKLVDD